MPRDECRDCERPITDGDAEAGGRCPACAAAYKERQPAVTEILATDEEREEEE